MTRAQHHTRAGRPGFVLLAVLCLVASATLLALGVALVARDALAAAQNRADLARAAWQAEGCAELARALAADVLTGPMMDPLERGDRWVALDQAVKESPLVAAEGCALTLRAAGSTLDASAADAAMLQALLLAAGLPVARADSMVDALLDWRDGDDEPRHRGAEREWYVAQGRPPPRNGPPADVKEISRVRGFEALGGIDTLLGVEPGRVALNRAPRAVLAALPGFTPEVVARIEERRFRGAAVRDLKSILGELSPAAQSSVAARSPDLARLATAEPDAWIITARARSGSRNVTVLVELRIVRAGRRIAVIRRRGWAG